MKLKLTAIATVLASVVCSASAVEVSYMMWDSNQLPAYKQCAADFEKKNPGTTIKITQMGFVDYWTTISTGFVSGTAPDVFANHLTKYPEFVQNGQLVDLMPLIQRDKLDTTAYSGGLFEIWGRAGKQYGLPKDWDTVAMVVNMEMAKKAGVTLADLQAMAWNPKDGGSFEQIARKLSLDEAGNNANAANFDKKKVSTYGYQTKQAGGMMGQTEWSHFAESNGFKFQDKPWDGNFHYDDPKLAEALGYLAGLPGKGISATYQNTRSLGAEAMFVGKKLAMMPHGSWMITYFKNNAKFEHAWVPLPTGPLGTRASMFNGLADSIWSGSKVQADAWKWVKYLGSTDCQGVVASYGVVFPAIKGMAEKAVDAHKAKGIDSSAFLTMAKSKTFLAPIADGASEITQIMDTTIESILMGKAEAGPALKAASLKVNQVTK